MHKAIYVIIIAAMLSTFVPNAIAQVNVIPRPAEVIMQTGSFKLDRKTSIISGEATKQEARYLATMLENAFMQDPAVKIRGKGIHLIVTPSLKAKLGDEGYLFQSTQKEITIEAATRTGVFYGIQSLRQLLPPDFELNPQQNRCVAVPCVQITDKPRFKWRAFMLDESRHFKGMEVVKNFLDQMALLKMNVFHWHLTDDQGWRIEIKEYPKLTEVGAYRKETQTSRRSPDRTGIPHGGFYTQEQIKELIRYAQDRHITIVPEIEMPGHAMAAIAAYPWLGVMGTSSEVPVTFGTMEDSYNISDPKVFQFLKDVLSEVIGLFPGKVIHIGGDEVKYDAWKNSEMIQKMIQKENLSSPADLQIFFTNRISNFIDSLGYRMMGWNEILGGDIHEWQASEDVEVEQSLAQSAIVHFWKGSLDLVNKAVTNGYDVVNSYHAQTYLDYNYQSIPLSKAYAFDPLPEGLDAQYENKILGSGCQMWSEWIPEVGQMEQQIFPRLAAYAEVGWTLKNRKDFEQFQDALFLLKKRWKLLGINYWEE